MELIDLTMPLNEETPVYPGSPTAEFTRVAYCENDGHNEHRICANTHFGTHIDAPWHMLADGKRLTDFPIERFVGRAVLFDVEGQKQIDVELEGVDENDIVILMTNHTKRAGTPAFFEENPVISRALAEKLVAKRVGMVGIDSFSPDNPPFDIHKLLLSNEVLIVENLVNLDRIGRRKFNILILPVKYDKIDGAPCRAVAQLD